MSDKTRTEELLHITYVHFTKNLAQSHVFLMLEKAHNHFHEPTIKLHKLTINTITLLYSSPASTRRNEQLKA